MIDSLENMISAVEEWIESDHLFVMTEVRKLEKEILDLNRDQLWDDGRGHDGQPIASGRQYSTRTVQQKMREGKPFKHVTLHDTGDFHDDFFIGYDDVGQFASEFFIESKDQKTPDLVTDWGSTIFGLDDTSITILTEDHLRPALIQSFRSHIIG